MTTLKNAMSDQDRVDLSPSAKFVFGILKDESPLTRAEILTAASPVYQEPTIDDALAQLRDANLVYRTSATKDCRKTVYHLK